MNYQEAYNKLHSYFSELDNNLERLSLEQMLKVSTGKTAELIEDLLTNDFHSSVGEWYMINMLEDNLYSKLQVINLAKALNKSIGAKL